MKEDELREVAECAACGNLFGEAHAPMFWRITGAQYFVDAPAIVRQDALAQVVGSSLLATALGPDEDMAHEVASRTVTVCYTCAMEKPITIAELFLAM